MKQVLIVNSSVALNGGAASPQNLTGMKKGGIGFYKLSDDSKWLSAKADEDFAIVLGRGEDIQPMIIPEVDFATLTVAKSEPVEAVAYKAEITIPTPTPNDDYTLVLVKLGKHFNERTNYTVTSFIPINGETTADELAADLGKQLQDKAEFENIDVTVEVEGAKITVEAKIAGDAFALKPADGLFGTEVTETLAVKATGDKAYVQDLASRGAAGKGFNDVYEDGPTIYPGYPEEVEDTTYNVYTLRFAVGRKSSKTRDERVNQLVHVVVPVDSAAKSTIETILGLS